jgi:hypothetical protein
MNEMKNKNDTALPHSQNLIDKLLKETKLIILTFMLSWPGTGTLVKSGGVKLV